MNSIFEFSRSKLAYMTIFIKICGENILTDFLGRFWLIEVKMELKMKNMGKWIRFLNFPYQNLVLWWFSWKSQKKNFDPLFKTFLTNRGKNENENEKIWKNEFNFWILHIKVMLYGTFHENLCKKNWPNFFKRFLTNRGKNED